MKHPRITTGIDIGTDQIKVVVIEEVTERGALPRIIATGTAKARGIRHGYVMNPAEAVESIREAKRQAESILRMPLKKAFLSIGGLSLDEVRASGETIISRADQEITELDLEKIISSARETARPHFMNRRILHEIPLEFRVDGAKVFGNPIGMQGTHFEADYLFVTTLSSHADALAEAVEAADIEVLDHMASPLAGSYVLLSRDQKTKGCVLLNIGAETTSLVVYDEGIPVSVKVIPEGSSHVTNDLALAFKISLEDAEKLKIGKLTSNTFPPKKVNDLINKRFERILELVDKHLKAIGKKSLPAGAILSGGGMGHLPLVDLTKKSLDLPARMADLKLPESQNTKVRDSAWAVAYGIAFWGLTGDTDDGRKPLWRGVAPSLSKFFNQFLP